MKLEIVLYESLTMRGTAELANMLRTLADQLEQLPTHQPVTTAVYDHQQVRVGTFNLKPELQ